MESRNILLVAPPFIPVSKDSVAGTEQIIFTMGKVFSELGHNVFTIAREDSEVYGTLIPGGFKDILIYGGAELEHFHQAMEYAGSVVRKTLREKTNLDVILDGCGGLSLPVSIEEDGPPVVCSLNLEAKYFINPKIFQTYKLAMRKRKDCFVAISKYIAKNYQNHFSFGDLSSRINVIYGGVILENFEFSQRKEDYLLYIGRIRKGKAPHLAIQAAKNTGNKIVVVGGNISGNFDGQYQDQEYFNSKVKPLLDSSVEWFGPANLKEKVKLMKNAKGVLFPIQEPEAFGLVAIESMACGTPVIAYDKKGGPSETILHGKTGFLVNNLKEMEQAIKELPNLNPENCLNHVRTNFDYLIMGKKYINLINSILQDG